MITNKKYDCEDCKYRETTYREYDTGYEEWECLLTEKCIEEWDCCPKNNKIIKMED